MLSARPLRSCSLGSSWPSAAFVGFCAFQFKPRLPCRYVLACIETKQGVKRGDRVWQIAFGSGFKCNSAVWRAMRSVNTRHEAWLDLPKSE